MKLEKQNYISMFLRTMADRIEDAVNGNIDALCIIVRKSGACSVVESHKNLTDAELTQKMMMLREGEESGLRAIRKKKQ